MSYDLEKTETPGIYRRGGRYVVVFRDAYGKQRRKSARTLKEARSLKARFKADVDSGDYRPLSTVGFVEYAEGWVATYEGRTARGIRPETLGDYKKSLDQYAIPFFARRKLAAIAPPDIKAYARYVAEHDHEGNRRTRPVSPSTVRLALAPVRALLATAFEEGVIRANPAAGVRVVQRVEADEGEERVKALSEAELRELLEKLPEEWRLFFRFLAHSGLRIGEAIALQWRHVDVTRRRVLVRRRYYRGSFAPPKSKYGRRDVPLSAGLAQELRELRAGKGEDELVFTSEGGQLVDQSNLMSRTLKPAAVEAGLGVWAIGAGRKRTAQTWVGFHSFRHSCATMLFRNGANAKQVQRWLGHHAASFTLDTYIHLLEDDLPDADFLDRVTGASDNETDNAATISAAHGASRVATLNPATSRDFPAAPKLAETAAAHS